MTLTNAANDFVTEYKEKLMLVNQSLQEGSWIINCNIKNSEITPAIIFSPPSNEWKRSWICKKCGHIFVKDYLE